LGAAGQLLRWSLLLSLLLLPLLSLERSRSCQRPPADGRKHNRQTERAQYDYVKNCSPHCSSSLLIPALFRCRHDNA
jgi:hypothetical protein